MKSSTKIIAAVLILLASSLLSACSGGVDRVAQKASVERIEAARALQKSASLRLEKEQEGQTLKVRVLIDNPERKPLTSVQSWLAYHPDSLRGVKVDTTHSDFDMPAPYTNAFDPDQGLLSLGAASSKALNEETLLVAELTFKVLKEGVLMIDTYDYQYDLSGHASVNMLVGEVPYNILLKPDSPLLVIEN